MAVRCAGSGAGADLPSGLPVVEFRAAMIPHTRLFSTNCDAAVLLKGKTLQSNIAHMGNTSISFRNMRWSWSRHGSMSSQFLGMKQFAPFNRRRKPFRSLRS